MAYGFRNLRPLCANSLGPTKFARTHALPIRLSIIVLRRGHKYPFSVHNMASEADEKPSGNDPLENTDPHKGALDRLSKDYRELSDKAQQLLTE